MNKSELISHIVNTIRENKGLQPVPDIDPDTHLRTQLELDSLDLAEFTVRIEKETGIDVFGDGIVLTIGQVLQRIPE